ncbi:DUF11 domain-containing protein [Clostridium botulinum]|uniref:Ig-like domain-containing protein n=1 Tax=Clostridium botulinum TaxID=1491 RepID=UPI000580B2E2|nr:Ig-like domain-containing protein [Clostridium botulinum]KOC46262.1 hypothetical protein ADU88_12265 [Clostridium botulinum]NFO99080.1 DUF11 domain-containing protein [Clostridium botulinum]OOV51107.1 hypothetical protein B1A66_11030 [Clostridium botulinum D/C]OOV53259.1 hypothetical protein B1A67_13650 [Clostridium botulinum D/C]OOV53678.1 hypothetical protein B0673_12500 [Clostridium botulinum D/C]
MSFNNIFSAITNGAITFTGNTLGLSKAANTQNAGTANSIGAFICTNPNVHILTYPSPPGTTETISSNSSSAVLNLPDGSTVLYAELIWGGTYKVLGQDYTNLLNLPINFILPNNANKIYKVYPQNQQTFIYENSSVYCNSCNVTSYVSEALSGTYETGNVVGTTSPGNSTSNCCGWTLAVVYKNSQLPYRKLSLYTGGEVITPTSTFSIPISNFQTPISGSHNARILVSALEGDAPITGDQLLLGTDANNLVNLSGPENPSNNFFGSQINNDSGQTDTLGSFGNRNQNVLTGTNIVAGRQGVDITNVDASNALTNSQTSGIIQFMTTEDIYIPTSLGVQIDMNAPLITISQTTSSDFVVLGDNVKYTITVTNNGPVAANNVVLKTLIPEGLQYTPSSLTVNSVAYNGNISQGIKLNTINPSASSVVTFAADVVKYPYDTAQYSNLVTLNYNFVTANGTLQGITESNINNLKTSSFLFPPLVPNYQQIAYKNTPVDGKILGVSSTSTITSYTLDTPPKNGFAKVNTDGTWEYTPMVNFVGTDSFSVLVTDANGDSSISTVSISVKSIFENQEPINCCPCNIIFPQELCKYKINENPYYCY